MIRPRFTSPQIIVLAGPTCVGKSSLALTIAAIIEAEIVSADAMQLYQKMDIATAKASREERERIPHHLLDIYPVTTPCDVVQYHEAAQTTIQSILMRGKHTLIVGGSGFYLQALLEGPPEPPPKNERIRQKLEIDGSLHGIPSLYQRLEKEDPHYAATITHNDRNKIIRGLEIIAITGRPVTSFSPHQPAKRLPALASSHVYFLTRERQELYRRIDARCDAMIQEGLLEEVKLLLREGLLENLSASHAIGYRHAIAFLDSPQKENDYRHFVDSFKQDSRRYAKRQLTWFRGQKGQWLNLSERSTESIVEEIIAHCNP